MSADLPAEPPRLASIEFTPDAPLTWRNAYRFPVQSNRARRDLVIGGLLFVVPPLGWVLNMGHRMQLMHRFHRGEALWPAWQNWTILLRNGALGLLAFAVYLTPGFLALWLAWEFDSIATGVLGVLLAAAGVFVIPGFMTFYCVDYDWREVFRPCRAVHRLRRAGPAYLRAWRIVLGSAILSGLGLFIFGVGFFFTTVWNWQVAAFCFGHVFRGLAREHGGRAARANQSAAT